jgi:hypothetical protein
VIRKAIRQASLDVIQSGKRHVKLRKDNELKRHAVMVINLDLTVQQEVYQAEELKDIMEEK